MKIQIASDIHLEMGFKYNLCRDINDILVVVGDVVNGNALSMAADWLEEMCLQYEYVLHVLGNHEYYNNSISEVHNYWNYKADMPENYIFLQKGVWMHPHNKDYVFLGCTLWSDLKENPYIVSQFLRDFKVIDELGGIDGYRERHENHLKWLDNTLGNLEKGKIPIVLTHHAPHINSIHEKYKTSEINSGFYSDLTWVFKKYPNIKYWVYGHTHTNADYMIGDTRVVCNPHGYANENPYFKDNLVLEI